MRSQFGESVQNFELKRVGGAPKGHQYAPLIILTYFWMSESTIDIT